RRRWSSLLLKRAVGEGAGPSACVYSIISAVLVHWRSGPPRRFAMSAPATVPVTITPEAADRVAELGMQAELEQRVEHARQTIPGLRRIDVTLTSPYDDRPEPGIDIEAYTERPFVEGDRTWSDWGRWKVTTFPPEVCEHFVLMLYNGPDNAR